MGLTNRKRNHETTAWTWISNGMTHTRACVKQARTYIIMCAAMLCLAAMSCSVSYKFNGASIDYSKTKTIQIADFPIRSSYVWGPMEVVVSTCSFAENARL